MSARAIWKGVIGFGDLTVPVKLYSAVSSQGLHFRLLHEKDQTPLKQKMVNPETGEIVPYEEVRKGYELDSGTFVLLDEEELDELEPRASRDIEITRFVDPAEIDHRWYERPYMVGPDGAEESYFALAAALEGEKKEGVARWVMRKKEYVGALRVEQGWLMLITLRHAEEVVAAEDLEAPPGRKPDSNERKMAEQLIGALEDEFDPAAWHDEYRERVMELIEMKARGEKPKVKKFRPKPTEEGALETALRQSVAAAKKRRASGG